MDEKETVFKYIKVVLDTIDSSWEELLPENKIPQPDSQPGFFHQYTIISYSALRNHQKLAYIRMTKSIPDTLK
ncbi:hypothetical protein YC2023_011661 [Brassica napus]